MPYDFVVFKLCHSYNILYLHYFSFCIRQIRAYSCIQCIVLIQYLQKYNWFCISNMNFWFTAKVSCCFSHLDILVHICSIISCLWWSFVLETLKGQIAGKNTKILFVVLVLYLWRLLWNKSIKTALCVPYFWQEGGDMCLYDATSCQCKLCYRLLLYHCILPLSRGVCRPTLASWFAALSSPLCGGHRFKPRAGHSCKCLKVSGTCVM